MKAFLSTQGQTTDGRVREQSRCSERSEKQARADAAMREAREIRAEAEPEEARSVLTFPARSRLAAVRAVAHAALAEALAAFIAEAR